MRTKLILGFVTLLMVPFLAYSEPTPEELEQNRRKLQEWRRHPERMQYLRKEADAYFALPEEVQKRIMSLDHDLHEESAAQQARLHNVMDRYVEWLDKLDVQDRQRIKDAPDNKARLAIIKDLRDQEWMKYQPKVLRERFTALQGEARTGFITKLRLEDRERRLDWQIATRFWKELDKGTPLPCRLSDLPADVNSYFADYLQFMLSKEEKGRLDKAQGRWPLYPLTLVELADKHPPALPGQEGPKYFKELPAEVQKRFLKVKAGGTSGPPKKIKDAEGKWPDFAHELIKVAAGKKAAPVLPLPHELWAWGRNCLSPPMQEFVDNKLWTVLNIDEKYRITSADAKWPDYPLAIQDLADKHNLQVPWQTLPGPRERWDNYRTIRTLSVQGLPEVPNQNLRDFVFFGLSAKERDDLKLTPNDPASLERLHHAYFLHYPEELKRLMQKNHKKPASRAP